MYWILTLLGLFLFLNPVSVSVGSRSIIGAANPKSNVDEHHNFAVDLNVTNFDSVLTETPATYAIVQFFAHWCPACRNYKPHYEKVARLFNGADAVHPGLILMTRVDCASKTAKMNTTNLCDRFYINHYPVLFWGRPSKFVSGSGEPKREKSEIQHIVGGRTADGLLNWINKQMGSSYKLDDEKYMQMSIFNQMLQILEKSLFYRAIQKFMALYY